MIAGKPLINEEHEAGQDDGHSGSLMDHYFNTDHLLHHVQDSQYFELFSLTGREEGKIKIKIPQISPWTEEKPLIEVSPKLRDYLGNVTFQPTKFVILELIAAFLVASAFIWLARKVKSGDAPKGKLWNLLEASVLYVRDKIAVPAIGSHDAHRFLPYVLTLFFFILTMNLMGMFPLFGAATGSVSVTIALALTVFLVTIGSGSKKLGVVGFWLAQVPHMDLPGPMGFVLKPAIWCIEVFGLFIKHMVLAIRLFANMFSGHMVLAVLVGFIGATFGSWLFWLVMPSTIAASFAFNLLELLVALIQAYVFAFLASLFIGSAIHPH